MLYSINEASDLIATGAPLLVAGPSESVSRLPRGNWIGGTTPYLLTQDGGIESRDKLLITPMPEEAELIGIQRYGMGGLHYLTGDSPENGFTIIIMPYGSLVHQTFAKEAPKYAGIFAKAITGWVSGIKNGGFGQRPQVFYGPIGHCIEDEVVAMHMALPDGISAKVDTMSVFEPGDGDVITFAADGFTTTHAFVNGKPMLFAEYLDSIDASLNIPMVADFSGTRLNVSLRHYDVTSGHVSFFAPVFRNVEYRFAKPIDNLKQCLRDAISADNKASVFSCICLTIFDDADLKSFRDSPVEGPVCFGEIAHLLASQTVTNLRLAR